MAKVKTSPIAENEHVKEFMAILRENSIPSSQDFLAMLKQVGTMEKQLEAAVKELAAMRQELKEAQEQNHPIQTALRKTIIVMQGQVLNLRDKLADLKQNVIMGCKNAVAAFKENGITALDNAARFFKVRPILETLRNELDDNIRFGNTAIAKIETISTSYHQAGRHLKNAGRAMLGKEAMQDVKPNGKLAEVISAPFRAECSCFAAMKKSAEAAIGHLAKLEEQAKPSIQKTMQTLNEQIAQNKKDTPAIERPNPAKAER